MQIVCFDAEMCCHNLVQGAARRKQPKTMTTLNVIVQDKKETLREYVDRAWKSWHLRHLEVLIFENNHFDDCKFKEELGASGGKRHK